MPPTWTNLLSPRGDSLRAAQWSPPSAARPSAVLVFHHGYGEHVQRYDNGEENDENRCGVERRGVPGKWNVFSSFFRFGPGAVE